MNVPVAPRYSYEYSFSFQFDRVCKLFCEDPATSQSDEFFGVFDFFLTSFSEAKQENENIRRKREEEEKIAKQHQEVLSTNFWRPETWTCSKKPLRDPNTSAENTT